jgi:hypothetical protein
MAKKAKESDAAPVATKSVSLSEQLQRKRNRQHFHVWLVGDTPLICHAWSEKAKRQMLEKQGRAMRGGKEARDPQQDFVDSLYDLGDGTYGFPAMAVKNAIVSVAHKDKGLARSVVQSALWIEHEMIRVRPALAGAICDMPLLRIYGSKPEMREDMVKIGSGLNRTANLAYRGQFSVWAMPLRGKVNLDIMDIPALAFLTDDAGTDAGIGEWRNDKRGVFGAFHRATAEEAIAWEKFAAGEGPLPLPAHYRVAAE